MHRKQKTPPKRGSKLVGERGFEPPTHWSQTSCATRLRYAPKVEMIPLLTYKINYPAYLFALSLEYDHAPGSDPQ